MMIARLEAELLFVACARRVARFDARANLVISTSIGP
jgi:hypothetical protein